MYTPLNIKTENTLLTSLIKIDELVSFAVSNNIKSLSITDTKMYGVYYFYKKCIDSNIKPIIGLDINYDGYRVILYCKNYNGYKCLLKISSLDKVVLSDFINTDDLICIVPYSSLDKYDELKDVFSSIFVGYKSKAEEELGYANMVYMDCVLCLNKSDLGYLKYLECIKTGKLLNEIPDKTNYLVSEDYVKSNFPKYIENNYKISDMCNFSMEYQKDLLPIFPCPDNMDSFSYLKSLCVSGMKDKFGSSVSKKYVDRLKYELDVINKMGFCNYFLVVCDYVKFAKKNDILVGPGRGSAAGSLVSYLLNITTVDPIKYNLLFERFLNPERVTMPDIDVDFEYTRREEVVSYCISKYGSKRVAPIITFGTFGAKQAIRDVGRCLQIPVKAIDRICSFINSLDSLEDNYKNNLNIKKFISGDKNLLKLYNVASRLEGLKRHTSIHAAGIVISNKDLDSVIPLDLNHDFYTTGYSMEFLEELGLLKMDFLALKNLTLINDVLKEVGISFDSIPMDDEATFKVFSSGNTSVVFQFESSGMISFLKKFKPNNFEDIVASIALYRPGPMSNIDKFIDRKHGKEKIDYIVPCLESILKSTYGIIVYQEQIMQIAQVMAGFSYGEADILRRAMSKKKEEVLIKERDKFIDGCINNGYSLSQSNLVYDLILKFASYGFNRAHSVAYALISYRIAYLKAHYPLQFMEQLLNSNIGSDLKIKEYISECKGLGIKIINPDINLSSDKFSVCENSLVFPLTSIKGIGGQYALKIISERNNGKFLNIFDFVKRCNVSGVMESLILAGCFDCFNYNKRTLIENLEKIINYSSLGDLLDDKYLPILDYKDEYDSKYLMEKEFDLFGFYLSNHPVTSYKREFNTIDLSLISNYFDKIINLVVYVDRIKIVDTKNGDKMCFITGSDEGTRIDVVMFPKVFDEKIKVHDILYLTGKVEKRYDKYQFVVNKINQIIE